MGNRAIKIHPQDNVAVVSADGGLLAGTEIQDGMVLLDDIAQGHKVALVDFAEGGEIIRYGELIGYSNKKLSRGSLVSEEHVLLPKPPPLHELHSATRKGSFMMRDQGYTFAGYKNPDGTAGTKNVFGIMTSVQCVAGVANYVLRELKEKVLSKYPNVDDVVAITHAYGCGVAIDAPDAAIPIRTLQNLMRNPNLGDELVVLGLGCEKLEPRFLFPDGLQESDHVLCLQDCQGGFQGMVSQILEVSERKIARLNERKRETCPISDLVVGVQCGGSDALSGLTANPAVGYAADMIVGAGGTIMFSEVSEVRDAIHLLTPRAASKEVVRALIREMEWYDNYLESGKVDRSANPTPGNKEGGLSNVAEKALGSIIKSGTSTIVDVLSHGEKVRKKGLVFAATPANDFICGTQQLASGMNLQVFTTGRGTPYNLSMVPVIKVSSRTELSRKWFDLIDFDAGRIATGKATIAEVGQELFEMILDTASGKTKTAADRLGLINDLAVFNPAPIT